MTETIESMVTPIDQLRLAQQLVEQARAQGVELIGPGGLLTGLTKSVLETALEAEMGEHLGYDKHDAMGRNGTRAKTVFTEIGPGRSKSPGIGTGPSSRLSCANGNAAWTASTRSCCC